MIEKKIRPFCLMITAVSLIFTLNLSAQPIRIKVVVDSAQIKATPEIGGRTVTTLPLGTTLEAKERRGEWYKIETERMTGYIHELLVEEISEQATAENSTGLSGSEKTQGTRIAEIEFKMEESRRLIRENKNFSEAIASLAPLTAKAFSITDARKQKELAAELYLWIGLAYAGQLDNYTALQQLKYMFDVDYNYGKEITRNLYDPQIGRLVEQAEKEHLGMIQAYSIEVSTEPKEADVTVNGEKIGLSPEVYQSVSPKVTLKVEKSGFETISEELFLTQATTKKHYELKSMGRNLAISTEPAGARLSIDQADTGQTTNCEVSHVPYGTRIIKLEKTNYETWENQIEMAEGSGPLEIQIVLAANAYSFAQAWGGLNSRSFKTPTGIAIDRQDNFYVVDQSDNKVKKYDNEGRPQVRWGDTGKEFKNLKTPIGVAVDQRGNAYITDSKKHNISKHDSSGKFIQTWGKEGSGNFELNTPTGIAADAENNIYVADQGNHRIKKFSSSGQVLATWGKQGNTPGNFVYPASIAVNRRNEIFVLDRTRVQKFSAEGQFIAAWGAPGTEPGQFNSPDGIAIDQYDYIYVADTGNHRIQKFWSDGRFIAAWGTNGSKDGQFLSPSDIGIISSGEVLVVDRDNNRIQKFVVGENSTR